MKKDKNISLLHAHHLHWRGWAQDDRGMVGGDDEYITKSVGPYGATVQPKGQHRTINVRP
jgi:hypothetical protein